LDEETKIKKLLEKHRVDVGDLERIIKGSGNKPVYDKQKIEVGNKKFSYAYFSDAHIGHKEFKPGVYEKMLKLINMYHPDFVLNIGDTLEGMSNRPGYIYELTHLGFNQQFDYAKELLSEIKIPIYGIDGNHDGWYEQKACQGIIVGRELQKNLSNYTHLGQMEGDLVVDGVKIKLFHGNDGTAYATSYKIQKLIESFSGGEKPEIVHSGHYHKALYLFTRNVHGVESGTLCGQSRFMRGKKIPAHVGFGFVRVWHNGDGEVRRFNHEFVPFYE
jgi:DNA polymerase II small subunit/DNA polymerase delta subunit B